MLYLHLFGFSLLYGVAKTYLPIADSRKSRQSYTYRSSIKQSCEGAIRQFIGITKGSSNRERGQLIPNRFMYGEEGTLAALLVNAVARYCQPGVCLSSKARL